MGRVQRYFYKAIAHEAFFGFLFYSRETTEMVGSPTNDLT